MNPRDKKLVRFRKMEFGSFLLSPIPDKIIDHRISNSDQIGGYVRSFHFVARRLWIWFIGLAIVLASYVGYKHLVASAGSGVMNGVKLIVLDPKGQPSGIYGRRGNPGAQMMAIFNPETQPLIRGIQQRIENCFIVGGLTSSRDKQFQIADQVYAGGISGVMFSENVSVLSNLSQGCSPVGERHKITRAQENVALSLDGKPALS